MNREFIINILFLVFINVLIKPAFIFGIDLTVQNRVGAEYGLYFALLNFSYVLQILNDFGVQNFNNRHVSQHAHLLPKYFPNLLALKGILAVLYFSLSAGLAFFVAGYSAEALPLLLVLLGNQILIQGILFLRSNVSGLGHFRTDSLLSVLDKFLMLLVCAVLLWGDLGLGPVTVMQFALAQGLALVFTLIIVFLVLRSKVQFSIVPGWLRNPRAGLPAMLFLLKKSFPYALVVLLMSAYTRLDGILLERILPDGKMHADVYAGAYRLLDASNMMGYLFASLLLPMFARMLGKKESVKPLAGLSFRLIWVGSITLAALVYFARQDLIELMMPARASAYRWDTLGVLIWAFVPVSTTYIFSTLLTADERLMQMNRFFLIGVALDVVLNLILVPRYQAWGAAWSTLGTQSFVALSMVGLCMRYYGFRPGWSTASRFLVFTGMQVLFSWLVFSYWSLPLLQGIPLVLVCSLVLLLSVMDFWRSGFAFAQAVLRRK